MDNEDALGRGDILDAILVMFYRIARSEISQLGCVYDQTYKCINV